MVPNLILNSFRRTIMPKGSFFPPPTKTRVIPAKRRKPGRTDKACEVPRPAPTPQSRRALPKIDDGDERHHRECHGAGGACARTKLQAPAA